MNDTAEEEALTLKQAAKRLNVSYGTVYARRFKIAWQIPDSNRWRVWPSTLAALKPQQYNVTRLAPPSDTEKLCQSDYAVKRGGSTSARRAASELDTLLERPTKGRQGNTRTA